MDKFFELHEENIIGYKRLSDADIGLNTGKQTHIGLLDGVLTFLTDSTIEESSILIYEKNCQILDVYFDRITRADGTVECPKIRKGGRNVVSMVTVIRDIINQNSQYNNWYILWFGLRSKQLVFLLLHDNSTTYNDLYNLGIDFSKKSYRITSSTIHFQKIFHYIENLLNLSSQSILKELEIEAQIPGRLIKERKIRLFDVERANRRNKIIGRKGEEILADYFDRMEFYRKIKSYKWVNKNGESGYPFDFYYQDLADNIIYLDSKATTYGFEQKIIYSDSEIDFALSQANGCYNIYRIYEYDLTTNKAKLKICKNCNTHFDSINKNIIEFKTNLDNISVTTNGIKLAFEPTISNLVFENEIKLEKIS